MPPNWNPTKRISVKFQEAQGQAWDNSSRNSIQNISTTHISYNLLDQKEDTTKTAVSSQQVPNLANTKDQKQIKFTAAKEDSGEDAAKLPVDWQQVWKDALVRNRYAISIEDATQVKKILKEGDGKGMGSVEEDAEEPGDFDQDYSLLYPSLSHSRSRSSSPTFSHSSIMFSDRKPQACKQDAEAATSEGASGSMMLKRCKAAKHYSTEEELGGSWLVANEEDADEECEMLDGVDVEDDWDLVPEMERFRIGNGGKGVGKKGFNERIKLFF